MDKFKYYVKRSYGTDRAYLIDKEASDAWQAITGRSTLSPEDMRSLRVFGVHFERSTNPEEDGFKKESN
jgi:hypothetical protein